MVTLHKANDTVVNAFRSGHWFSYVWLVDKYDNSSEGGAGTSMTGGANTLGWTLGGFQGGEGCDSAAEWNVENSLDELDSPNEWYLDRSSGDLYFFPNTTAGTKPGEDVQFAGTMLEQLVTITGGGSAAGDMAPHAVDIHLQVRVYIIFSVAKYVH